MGVVYIDYPAIPVDLLNLKYAQNYEDSVHAGEKALDKALHDFIGACPSTYIVVAGYSQGARVAGDEVGGEGYFSFNDNDRKHIAALILIGDPRFNPKQPSVDYGDYNKRLSGIEQWVNPQMRRIPRNFIARTISVCTAGDPICNYSKGNAALCGAKLPFGTCPHLLYGAEGWTRLSASWAIQRWRALPRLK